MIWKIKANITHARNSRIQIHEVFFVHLEFIDWLKLQDRTHLFSKKCFLERKTTTRSAAHLLCLLQWWNRHVMLLCLRSHNTDSRLTSNQTPSSASVTAGFKTKVAGHGHLLSDVADSSRSGRCVQGPTGFRGRSMHLRGGRVRLWVRLLRFPAQLPAHPHRNVPRPRRHSRWLGRDPRLSLLAASRSCRLRHFRCRGHGRGYRMCELLTHSRHSRPHGHQVLKSHGVCLWPFHRRVDPTNCVQCVFCSKTWHQNASNGKHQHPAIRWQFADCKLLWIRQPVGFRRGDVNLRDNQCSRSEWNPSKMTVRS